MKIALCPAFSLALAASLSGLALIAPRPAAAEIVYPYCAMMVGEEEAQNCGFDSLAQCRAAMSGLPGYCMPNPRYVAAPPAAPIKRPRHPGRG